MFMRIALLDNFVLANRLLIFYHHLKIVFNDMISSNVQKSRYLNNQFERIT